MRSSTSTSEKANRVPVPHRGKEDGACASRRSRPGNLSLLQAFSPTRKLGVGRDGSDFGSRREGNCLDAAFRFDDDSGTRADARSFEDGRWVKRKLCKNCVRWTRETELQTPVIGTSSASRRNAVCRLESHPVRQGHSVRRRVNELMLALARGRGLIIPQGPQSKRSKR